jgi:three-Cys-motif partner protein
MPAADFHDKPFDEGTLTKLEIFELYAKNWLPVFLSSENPKRQEIHIFDFFAGPGTDSKKELGSPLLLLQQLKASQRFPGWNKIRAHVHYYDEDTEKITRLNENIDAHNLRIPRINFDIQPLQFEDAFRQSIPVLSNPNAAKLVFIDQTGVGQVTKDIFLKLVSSPVCDFLFFISSSTLHRFHDHPAIKQKIDRPDDYFHVHRKAVEYYRDLLPSGKRYFLAPFSIKKGANIYGVIFGSAHPLGMDKFLEVAWKKDSISGEANFDINRENIQPDQMRLFSDMPTKLTVFAAELERLLRDGQLTDELAVMRVCFDHGVRRQHASPVLAKLKKDRVIQLDFKVPDIRRLDAPRRILRGT